MGTEKIKSMYLCPLCGKEHIPQLVERDGVTLIKGDKVTYKEQVIVCDASEEESETYVTSALSNKNLLAARDAYREQHHLLTSSEIASLRKSYRLTQSELAGVLGWGEVTITRYETKAIQDEAHDGLLRIIRDNPMELLRFVERNRRVLTEEKLEFVRNVIENKMAEGGTAFLRRWAVQSAYLAFRKPDASNGKRVFDEATFAAAVSYLAGKVQHLYKTRLMKMLWYADSLAYRDQGRSITGLVYRHMPMGALPVAHNELLELDCVRVREEERDDGSVQYLVEPCDGVDLGVLNKCEREVLDHVVERFKYCNAKAIVDTMHKERAYVETAPGQIISFEFAPYVTL